MNRQDNLNKLADFIEKYPDFNHRSIDNDIIGIGNRLNLETNELNPHHQKENGVDYFGEDQFAKRFDIELRNAVNLCSGDYSKLVLGLKNPDTDKDGFKIISRKQAVNAIRKFAKTLI